MYLLFKLCLVVFFCPGFLISMLIRDSGNLLKTQQSLDGLLKAPNLKELSLEGCPVTNTLHYRHYIISHCPHLQVLDNMYRALT